ncbi:MAG TPA: hypothetical protein VFS51_08955 [Gemmatimonadales bacterium]|nr:hypothetical protein [Gemmatimonadales bacterium]
MRSHPLFHLCWLLAIPSALPAQATCPDSIAGAMKFLQGNWEGRSYSIAGTDTTFDALMSIESRPLYGGCVLEERWSATNGGKPLFNAKVLRAYDAGTRRWLVYYVDDGLNSQFYEGKPEGGPLAVRPDPNGPGQADHGPVDLAARVGRLRTVDRAIAGWWEELDYRRPGCFSC